MRQKYKFSFDYMDVLPTTHNAYHCILTNKEEGKDQESIQSSATPDTGHGMGKLQNTRKHHTQESPDVSPFTAGDNKAAMNRQDSMAVTKYK